MSEIEWFLLYFYSILKTESRSFVFLQHSENCLVFRFRQKYSQGIRCLTKNSFSLTEHCFLQKQYFIIEFRRQLQTLIIFRNNNNMGDINFPKLIIIIININRYFPVVPLLNSVKRRLNKHSVAKPLPRHLGSSQPPPC